MLIPSFVLMVMFASVSQTRIFFLSEVLYTNMKSYFRLDGDVCCCFSNENISVQLFHLLTMNGNNSIGNFSQYVVMVPVPPLLMDR